jgi:hypothetical protein
MEESLRSTILGQYFYNRSAEGEPQIFNIHFSLFIYSKKRINPNLEID